LEKLKAKLVEIQKEIHNGGTEGWSVLAYKKSFNLLQMRLRKKKIGGSNWQRLWKTKNSHDKINKSKILFFFVGSGIGVESILLFTACFILFSFLKVIKTQGRQI
jgi:hypothetical protein